MANKTSTLLKVSSVLYIILSVLWLFISELGLLVLVALPQLIDTMVESGELAAEITPLTYISIILTLICSIVNIVIAVMALKHKNLNTVYKVGIFTMLCVEVFNFTSLDSISDVVDIILGLAIPLIFLYAVFKQNRADLGEGK